MRSDLHDYRTHVERLVQIQIYERLAVDVDPVFRGMGYDGLRDAVDDGELNPVLREAATAALRRIAGAADYSVRFGIALTNHGLDAGKAIRMTIDGPLDDA